MYSELFASVSSPRLTPAQRLEKLKACLELYENGGLGKPVPGEYVNNHIHTIYSFSPYSPSGAALAAWQNSLTTAGIMDHDSVSGAKEFIEAGKLLGIATTVGFECRCSMEGTEFETTRINNPDQKGVAYVACHGIPKQNIEKAKQWIEPYKEKRNIRNRKMVDNINRILDKSGIKLDFDKDVVPLSQNSESGSVTERHILYALSVNICTFTGKGKPVLDFLKTQLSIVPEGKNLALLEDAESPSYEYSLLNVLKGSMVEQFYIPATDECPKVSEFVQFVKSIGAIPAYAYLGDVGQSVTGDKKSQSFEDAYLDRLVQWLAEAGFSALTYMPTRNTKEQLKRVMDLCDKHGLFQISGEDINSPSQSFICKALDLPEYRHLISNTWALIGHEKAAGENIENAMFSVKSITETPNLYDRIKKYELIGKNKLYK